MFTYTPNAGFIGTDTFTYQDYGRCGVSTVATATIAITENPPVAHNDSYSVTHGQTLSVPGYVNGVYVYSVLNNDSDADGDSITASLVSNVQHGTLSFSPNGMFTYTPAAGFYGTRAYAPGWYLALWGKIGLPFLYSQLARNHRPFVLSIPG